MVLKRYESELARSQELEQRTQANNERLTSELAAALDRVESEADRGDPAARAAIESARQTGDVTRLQAVLVAEADRVEECVRADAAEYVELAREIAAVAFLRGDIAEAERRVDSILRFFPDDRDAWTRRGHIHHLRGDLTAAAAAYQRVLELSPADEAGRAVALGNLGLIHQTRGELNEAERMHRKALPIN